MYLPLCEINGKYIYLSIVFFSCSSQNSNARVFPFSKIFLMLLVLNFNRSFLFISPFFPANDASGLIVLTFRLEKSLEIFMTMWLLVFPQGLILTEICFVLTSSGFTPIFGHVSNFLYDFCSEVRRIFCSLISFLSFYLFYVLFF